MEKKIVIVGAGYAGVLTAKKLAKKFKKDPEVSVTLIDKNPFHTMLTELHEVAASRVSEDSIRIDLGKVFSGRRVDVRLDTVTSVDFTKKEVIGTQTTYPYDYLVLSTGSKPTYFGIPGAKEHTFPLWSYADAVKLRDHINETFYQASLLSDEQARRKLLTFHVVGAGFSGVEMMGELAEYVPIICKKFSLNPKEVTMINVDGMPRAIPNMPEKLSNKVERRLHKMGVQTEFNAFVAGIGDDYIEFKRHDQIERQYAHTVIWTAGIESSDLASKSGKELEASQRAGRIETDAYLRAKGHDDVYVVGDNIYYVLEGETRPVPQMVENAEHSAKTVAGNIASSVRGETTLKPYTPAFHGAMVCVGGRYGVARVGTSKFQLNLPSFLAMFVKHFINVVYFVQVLGWNRIYTYCKHEFFTIRNRRSFVGGHFSNVTPSFMLVPLRVWLGIVWVLEGIIKISEGWLSELQLGTFFSSANDFFKNILDAAQVSGAHVNNAIASGAQILADTGAGASTGTGGGEVAQSAGHVFMNWNLGLFQSWIVSAKPAAESQLADVGFKLNVPILNNMMDWMLGNEGLAFFMQASIVIIEILIGLALIGGLFTFLSATVSVILQLGFLMTTGWYLTTIWMFMAGIAMMFGAGQTIGLDYYVLPKLKAWWKRLPWIRKWYFYND